jgi:iron only hydrogenase large subunit-like protein
MNYPKNNIPKIEKILREKNKAKKEKLVIMLAPSFAAEFEYPRIIHQLKELGFEKVVELTFGAKLVNKEYHKIIGDPKNKKKLLIATVCPGIVETIKQKYPKYRKNLIAVDSPMIAMAKICKKIYPEYKTVFISPCNYKKLESEESKYVDYTIDNLQLKALFEKYNIKGNNKEIKFDKFYNDYTKIYPLAGGLSKTAHLKGILKPGEEVKIDGILEVEKFLKNPDKKVRFMDVTFCHGGCIGGPAFTSNDLMKKKDGVMHYMHTAEKESIPLSRKGLIRKAAGIDFSRKY